MIKRPLNSRFSAAVLEGRKITTIRDKAWLVDVPIMLYSWSGAPYRSKQVDVAAIIVSGFWTIQIARMDGDAMRYAYGMESEKALYETEGFDSREDLDAWFRPLLKPGQSVIKHLMRFRLQTQSEVI